MSYRHPSHSPLHSNPDNHGFILIGRSKGESFAAPGEKGKPRGGNGAFRSYGLQLHAHTSCLVQDAYQSQIVAVSQCPWIPGTL